MSLIVRVVWRLSDSGWIRLGGSDDVGCAYVATQREAKSKVS